jgi:hypothetical protein
MMEHVYIFKYRIVTHEKTEHGDTDMMNIFLKTSICMEDTRHERENESGNELNEITTTYTRQRLQTQCVYTTFRIQIHAEKKTKS